MGSNTKNDPVTRFALFTKARELAAQAANAELALSTIDHQATHYEIDHLKAKGDLLVSMSKLAGGTAARQAMIAQCNHVIDLALVGDQYDTARRVAAVASAMARDMGNSVARAEAARRIAEVNECDIAYTKSKAATATLARSPSNPDANLVAGTFRCFVRGDWNSGLPMLAAGRDPVLKALAQRDLAAPADAAAQAALADAWWELAEQQTDLRKRQVRQHAAMWYQKSIPQLNGFAKASAEKRLKDAMATGAAGTPVVDLLKMVGRSAYTRRVSRMEDRSADGAGCNGRLSRNSPAFNHTLARNPGHNHNVEWRAGLVRFGSSLVSGQ